MRRRSLYEKPAPDLRLVFKSEEYVRCICLSLVIKIDAINEKYDGGLKRFTEKYLLIGNRDLVVKYAMSTDDMNDIVQDLKDNGFVHMEDALLFDAMSDAMILGDYAKAILSVDWLEGYYKNNETFVRLVKKEE